MKKKLLALAIVLAIIAILVPTTIFADAGTHTYYVATTGNDSNPGTSASPFLTIGHAVSVATSGTDTIDVEAGTNIELLSQVVIANNLTIVGAGASTTIIKPSVNTVDTTTGDSRGWFLINTGVTFNLSGLTLDGSGKLICIGILNHGQGTITNCVFKNLQYNESTDYAGRAIASYGGTDNVTYCTLSGIGRIGIYYNGIGTSGSIVSHNTYIGKGSGDWLDYGVEAEGGAAITITDNTISGCIGVASVDGSTSAAVMATTYYGSGTTITVTGNNLFGNYDGVSVGYGTGDTTSATVNNNNLAGNTYGVDSVSSNSINAESNWWGTSNSTAIAALVIGNVDYSNYLSSAAGLYGTIGSGGSDGVVVNGTFVGPSASITAPSGIGFGTFVPTWNYTPLSATPGSVTVNGSAGTAHWTVTATGYKYMTNDGTPSGTPLSNFLLIGSSTTGPWFIANGGSGTVPTPSGTPYSGALIYSGTTSSTSLNFAAAQYIAPSDASVPTGVYSDTITFTLSIMP